MVWQKDKLRLGLLGKIRKSSYIISENPVQEITVSKKKLTILAQAKTWAKGYVSQKDCVKQMIV